MNKDVIFLGIIGLFLIGFGAFIFMAPKTPEITYKPVDVGGGSITVENQMDLNVVTLDAELAAPGWITIHENLSGAPADIIGTSTYLEAGVHTGLTIPVSPEMLPGYRYITLLHVDNGDQVFVVEDDLPVMVNDAVVRPDFIAGQEPGDETSTVDIPGTDDSIEVDPSTEVAPE